MKPTLLVLAAGMGSRYGGIKQLDRLGPAGETIIDYSIYDAIRSGFGRVVFVIRKSIEQDFTNIVLEKFKNEIDCDYVFQELDNLPAPYCLPQSRKKPWGTGHAVLMAANKIQEPFAVINADDFYGYDAFQKMSSYLQQSTPEINSWAMVGYLLKNTLSEHGFVSRGICEVNKEMLLQNVVERTQIQRFNDKVIRYKQSDGELFELSGNSLVSMNFWGFTPTLFPILREGFSQFLEKNIEIEKSEYYIPTPVNEQITQGSATVEVLETTSQWFGVTYQEDRPAVVEKIKQLVAQGVYPEQLF